MVAIFKYIERNMRNNKKKYSPSTIKKLEAKTTNQEEFIRSLIENIVTICYGPAGSGKSYLSIGISCHHLHDKKIEKVVVAKPIIGCGNELGSLPGDVEGKIHPYMVPSLDYFRLFLGQQFSNNIHKNIELYPIELIRGHTYHNAYMILEEAQNCTPHQIKLFLSRIGRNSRAIIIGDNKQTDIYNNGLEFCIQYFKNIKNVGLVEFNTNDIIRNGIIPHILEVFEKNGV